MEQSSKYLAKAQSYCAYQERSQHEVRIKLKSWGLNYSLCEQIISNLISEGFLKEERFAMAYAQGKMRVKKWGRNLIRKGLTEKKVSGALISQALNSLDDSEYLEVLRKVIKGKKKIIKEKDPLKIKFKLASYAISRGFESDLVWNELGRGENE
ncbi:MAG: RecX family transcriptional regulator [Bacteroidetes bacterium]|nr:MAG: RecX family transcriptional regulator [Bacteroidota bacterium]REK05006.1 MAG: RecX family transcriptional regulator [Bacteroidota bacterium]REK36577.1 MAG: RecX family transcriptional regulator [Bacteroidota bacterium]REK51737.1 MAG: RecX family transcriptional regulator [Bacteroidota bacterium]